ncbi:hypothetical protein [Novosphingobium sp. 17-62-19]|uniref:hypothetical protein n=1 Tax=Novosphingobium sp. 17-62-19 TaxID=1970406 RepID=UPI0025F5CF42|nr:hypothetical protein [Novosphingobium sp. 17-62-19]HQS95072.1 hypothetical protein [Novosphingobium sp.]
MFDIQTLIAAQQDKMQEYHRAMAQRPEGCPRAAWLAQRGVTNIAWSARDTERRSAPVRQLLLGFDGYDVMVLTAAGRSVEIFNLKAADAQARLARYV